MISPSGLLTAVAPGPATVTANSGAVVGSTVVVVVAPVLRAIAVNPAAPSLPAGLTQQFTATGTFSDGSTADLTGTVVWSASPSGVGSITGGGLATAAAPGSLSVTVAAGSISGGATLTVTPATLTGADGGTGSGTASSSGGCASGAGDAAWLALLMAALGAARRRAVASLRRAGARE